MSSKRHPAPQQARSLLENHALEALGIALLQLDTQKCITSVNEPALMLLGTKDAAWLGRDFSEAFLPVDGGAPLELARSAETQWVSLRATSGDTERPVRAGILAVEGGYLIRLQPSLVAMAPEQLGEMLATESAKVAEWTTQLSRGDFVAQLELTAQNDDNGIVLELLRPIVDATRAFRDQVIAVLNEARLLATAATQGRLHVRADPSNHAGEFARTVAELNQALSATTEPIALMAAQLADLAEGKIPPALPTAFSGDFSVMQVALDRCAAGLAGLREVALGLSALSRNDTSHGVDLSLPGVFGDIVSETNQLRRQMLRLTALSQRVSAGDLSDLVELEAVGNGRGRMCENDRLTPAFIQLIRAILALSDEAAALLAAARAGDLTRRADDRGLCGRIRDAVASINETLDALQAPIETAIGVLESVARQDLRARVTGDFRGNHGRLQAAINQMADLLHSSIESVASNGRMVEANAQQLLAATQSMSSNAEQTSNRARTASQAVEEVDEHVQSVAAAIQQMTASINEIARNGADAMQVAQDATKVADGASSIVTSLGKSSKQISRVLSVIDTIAQQTKLLALNATIEAASAGEAGKGFAVVAGEVKELAKGTARATEDISEKVEAIQASVAGAINAISEITTVIHRIEKSQAAIASAVEEQTATTVEIAQRVAESAQRTSELSTNLSGLAVAASRTTELASDSRSASIHLRDMAERLLKTVAGYQI